MKTDLGGQMKNNQRNYLKKGDRISLRRNGHAVEEWEILRREGEGASSICYQARCGEKYGRLKEYAPLYTAGKGGVMLKRDRTGQLLPFSPSMQERFSDMCADFERAYLQLEAAKRQDARNLVLNNYIPPFEILHGYAPETEQQGSIYIWTPDDKKGMSFDAYLAQVRKYPHTRPEWKLYKILGTLLTLTDCVKALHSAGLLHLDLKPSNFLVPFNSDMELNTHSISLFDVNTLYALDSVLPRSAGTKGFQAPEAARGRAENRSDIYSLGAILFHGIVITDTVADGLYRDGYYENISHLLASSELITASGINENVFLKYRLTRILQKSLAKHPKDRYGSCEELTEDLEKAIACLLPAITRGKLGEGRKLDIVDQESGRKDTPQRAICQLLYQDPLYQKAKDGDVLDVLAVGAGTCGQKFIDICLQAGQLLQKELRITAVSAEPQLDREVYLHFRPALPQFVDVDDSMQMQQEKTYGSLCFCKGTFSRRDDAENRRMAETLFAERTYSYIFISLGDDSLNEAAAKAFCTCVRSQKADCSVHFVVQGEQEKTYSYGNPVYIHTRIRPSQIDPELERMAFLTHLCWNGTGADPELLKKQFRQKYNYESSLFYAMSVSYKLQSIGIDTADLKKAAAVFEQQVLQAKDSSVFARLTALEHRRWLIEKVTDGWTAPENAAGGVDLESCVRNGAVKDLLRRKHPCIVRSTEAAPLQKPPFTDPDHRAWDEPTAADDTLDELDRMSVELHRCFRKRRDAFCRMMPLQRNGDAEKLRRDLIGTDGAVQEAHQHYHMCLQDILEGSRKAAEQFSSAEKMLLDALQTAEPSLRRRAQLRMQQIARDFFPAVECNLYRDYKANDAVLIEKIPFIMTFVPQPCVLMPFSQQRGSMTAVLETAAVFHPKRITFLSCLETEKDAAAFLQQAASVTAAIRKRRIRSRLAFLICLHGAGQDAAQTIEETLYGQDVTLLFAKTEQQAAEKLLQAIRNRKIDLYCEGGTLFSAETELLWQKKLQQTMPDLCRKSAYLRYFTPAVYLHTEDVYHLQQKCLPQQFYPEFSEEYRSLWQLQHTFGADVWQKLCQTLAAHGRKQDLLVSQPLKRGKTIKHLQWFFPAYGYQTMEKLLRELQKAALVDAASVITGHTSDTCRLELSAACDLRQAVDAVLSVPAALIDADALQIEYKEDILWITADQPVVRDLRLTDAERKLLEELHRMSLITGLRTEKDSVSFVYSSARMKRMLTDPDELLRTCAYYELSRSGHFDEILWQKNGCVMTKGFRIFFLEAEGGDGSMFAMAERLGGRKLLLCREKTAAPSADIQVLHLQTLQEDLKSIMEGENHV